MSKSTFVVRAPGRVSLMGGGVDYNGGPVIPIAIPLYIEMHLEPTNEDRVELYAEEIHQRAAFSLTELSPQNSWIDYVQGVAAELSKLGIPLRGFRGVVKSTLPMAAGLSSSAALEVAAALAFLHLAKATMTKMDVALLCQRAENHFVGVQCGVSDQAAISLSKADHAMLLYCDSMQYEYLPLVLDQHVFVVTYSGAPRELAASAYNERRASCQQAVSIIQKDLLQIKALCDLSPDNLPQLQKVLSPILFKRTRHVVTEIDRTKRAAVALKNHDLVEFGMLMNQTHDSLRDDYQVSSKELNWLVDWARSHPGVQGSRLTGAGFGGCTVTLIRQENAAAFIQQLPKSYAASCGLEANCWAVNAVEGAHVV